MKIKVIVLDMDGTLLTRQKGISERTLKALIKVQEAGVKVILASGRATSGMKQFGYQLKMDEHHGYLISFNGAAVIDCQNDELIYAQAIQKDRAKALLDHLEKFDVIPMIYSDTHLWVNNVFEGMINAPFKGKEVRQVNIIEYESRGSNLLLSEAKHLADALNFPLFKVLVAADAEYLRKNYEALADPFRDSLNSSFSAPFYYEFTDKNIDKANTMDKVLKQLGIKAEEVMAFGDGHNDATMIQYAGIGIAMGNAEEAVKAIADEITLSNDEDGIALKLEEYFSELF